MNARLTIALSALLLTACDIPGLGPDPRVLQREAEARAIGGACRQALRGIEDCYALNEKAPKTAVFEGWREMDAYMRENKLEGQRPLYGKDAQLQQAMAAQAQTAETPAAKPAEPKEEVVEDKKTGDGGKPKAGDKKPDAKRG